MLERKSEHLVFIVLGLFHVCSGDIGTAGQYAPPYLRKHQRPIPVNQSFETDTVFPFLFFFFFFNLGIDAATACYGNDVSKFPSNNLFASAGDGIWDNGAACGREYFVKCLSAQTPGTCKAGQIIKVKVVDRASRNGVVLVLSTIAFGVIADPSVAWVTV
ncbi:hypothetical protein PVL29_004278 [Vitis rotundifolia]|uniref:Expansin-like EG45 domain-containing protein n=1 Tax=Vitis rotundifolia TaxID=103349 RepID=A0AA39DY94_VITRO|nr:hypothetical protein PVL29_004278 [Vitis rotundifolia]